MSGNRSGSSPWSGVLTLGLGLGLTLGACIDGVFVCSDDADCANGDLAGVCQDNGRCSFPDMDCPSGQRYGDLAEEGIAEACVPTTSDTTPLEGSEDGADQQSETGPDDIPPDDTTGTGLAESTDTTGDFGLEESSSSGDIQPLPSTDCPDDPDLALCLDFESFEGSTVYDDRDPAIAGALIPTAEIVDGPTGNVLSVSGDGGHLNLGSQLYPTGSFTVEVWCRLAAPSGEWPTLINRWTEAGGYRGFWLGLTQDGNGLEFWVDTKIASAPAISLDTWTRVTATHDADSGAMRLYVDGRQVGSEVHLGPLTPTSLDLRLGDGNFGASLHGQLDGVRLWNRALSPDEI